MSYPLIQQPAPLQQLAQTIQAIQQQRQLRQAQALQQMLGQAQLENAQNENALAPLRRSEMLARINQANVQTRGEEQTQAQRARQEALNAERLHQHAAASALVTAALLNHPNEPTHPEVLNAFARARQIATDPVVQDQLNAEFKRALELPAATASAAAVPRQQAEAARLEASRTALRRRYPQYSNLIDQFGPEQAAAIIREREAQAGANQRASLALTARGAGRPPTAAERVAASQAASVEESVRRMEDIARTNPAALQQAVAVIRSGRIPTIGPLLENTQAIFTNPDASEFYNNYNNFLLAVTPTYGGSRPTRQLLDLEKAATLPLLGANPAVAFARMRARLRDVQAKAGAAMPPEAAGATTGGPFDDFLGGPPGGQP